MTALELNIGNWPSQDEIFYDPAKFKIVPKGRRYGLTRGAANFLILSGLQGRFQYVLWGDTILRNIEIYVDTYFLPHLKKLPANYWSWNKMAKKMIIGKMTIHFRSADNTENWEGYRYDFVFLNEAGIILKNAFLWNRAVQPMMLDNPNSSAVIGGVPRGRNLFYELYEKSINPDYPNYKCFRRTTFDNPFLKEADIQELMADYSPQMIRQEIYGEFVDFAAQSFLYSFERQKHLKKVVYERSEPVYLALDFNVNPLTCIAVQFIKGEIRIIREYHLANSNIYELCRRLKADYPPAWCFITGDASGSARSALTQGDLNYYRIIVQEFGVAPERIRVPKANPSHANSGVLCNAIFRAENKIFIDPSCKFLLEDIVFVETNPQGTIIKDKDLSRGHLLDCLRYYLNTFHHDFLQK